MGERQSLSTIYIVISKGDKGQAPPRAYFFGTNSTDSSRVPYGRPSTPRPPAPDRPVDAGASPRWAIARPPTAGGRHPAIPLSRAYLYPHPVPRLRSVRAQSVPPVPPTPVRTPRRSRGLPKGSPRQAPHNNVRRACRPFGERQEAKRGSGSGRAFQHTDQRGTSLAGAPRCTEPPRIVLLPR